MGHGLGLIHRTGTLPDARATRHGRWYLSYLEVVANTKLDNLATARAERLIAPRTSLRAIKTLTNAATDTTLSE